MIEVSNLDFYYGKSQILKSVSFNIEGGEVISIIGENGCGKSTLLSNVCRLFKVEKNIIEIDGLEINQYKNNDLAKVIAILKQDNAVDIKYSVYDIISMGRFPYSKGKLTETDKEKINEIIKHFKLDDLKDKIITNLSGGQKQIVLIAMIFVQDSKYVFLDEPLNNLDVKNSVKTMNMITKFAREYNKTIILIMHDLNYTLNYSTHILGLKKGSLLFYDEVERVVEKKLLDITYDVEFDILRHNNKYLCSLVNYS